MIESANSVLALGILVYVGLLATVCAVVTLVRSGRIPGQAAELRPRR